MKAFQASSNHGSRTGTTPRAAATAFFNAYPKARKCDVREGDVNGHFFTLRFAVGGMDGRRWSDVSRRSLADLPAE